MLVQGLLSPLRETGKFVVIGIVKTEIIRQLPADDEFLQEGLFGLRGGVGLLNLPGHPLRGDLAEMEVGGKVGQALLGSGRCGLGHRRLTPDG